MFFFCCLLLLLPRRFFLSSLLFRLVLAVVRFLSPGPCSVCLALLLTVSALSLLVLYCCFGGSCSIVCHSSSIDSVSFWHNWCFFLFVAWGVSFVCYLVGCVVVVGASFLFRVVCCCWRRLFCFCNLSVVVRLC